MAACLGTLLASECLCELMPSLTGLPDTDQRWLRNGVVEICGGFGATNHRKQSLCEECLPSISRRSCQYWQGVSGGTSLTFSQMVLRPVCFSGVC